MKKLRRAVLFTLAVVLSLTLFFPVRAAETVYFTAINDSLMTLSSDTMPCGRAERCTCPTRCLMETTPPG